MIVGGRMEENNMKLTYTLTEAIEKFSDRKETTYLYSIDNYKDTISIDNEKINFYGVNIIHHQLLWSPYYYTESFDKALKILKNNKHSFRIYIDNAMMNGFAYGNYDPEEPAEISKARTLIKDNPFQPINTWLNILSLFGCDDILSMLQSSVFYIEPSF